MQTPPLQDPSGQPVTVIGDAFRLVALVDDFDRGWEAIDPSLPVIDYSFVELQALAASPQLAAFLRKSRGEQIAGFGPDYTFSIALDGGLGLFADGAEPILPGYNGALDDYGQWEELASFEQDWWQEFYTGRENLLARRGGGATWISGEHGAGGPCVPEGQILVVDTAVLKARIAEMVADLERLVPRVEAAIEGIANPKYRTAAARSILGLDFDVTGWWDDDKA